MHDRPYVLLSCAMSLDGYLDDTTSQRLLLSNDDDFDRVDQVRASVDAIMVGATTIRADNPRLLVRSQQRQQERTQRGLPAHPTKVTVTATGEIDPSCRFLTAGDTDKLLYTATAAVGQATKRCADAATVIDAGDPVELPTVLDDLRRRGIGRLMVEGGGSLHTQFLTQDLADELQLVVAPLFVGDANAPRFVGPGHFPHGPERRMRLAETRQIGDVVLLRYLPASDVA